MWLFVATVAEVPPAVGSASALAHALVVHHLGTLQVLIILDLNGIFFLSKRDVAPTQFFRNVRSTQPRTLFVVIMYVRLSYPSATQMFQLPTLITMAMAATRMYRSLTDFGTGSADMYDILSFLFSSSPARC